MCLWVRALDVYGRMVKVVEPKRKALHQAEKALAEIEAQLTAKREQLRSCSTPFHTDLTMSMTCSDDTDSGMAGLSSLSPCPCHFDAGPQFKVLGICTLH